MDLKNKIMLDMQRRKSQRGQRVEAAENGETLTSPSASKKQSKYVQFDSFDQYKDIQLHKIAGEKLKISSPFFRVHEGLAKDTSVVEGREMINFSSYDYLGINGHPRQLEAAKQALERYGVSSSASRLVSGERPIQQQLEKRLARLHGVDDAAVFVSGHATNVSTIGALFGERDLILHDELIHNSIIEGAKLSGAKRISFEHNNLDKLERLLSAQRKKYKRVLIAVEGIYSMDGDHPNLPRLVEIKKAHSALLMVDEAHSVGVMGKSGRGIAEFFAVGGDEVDIWMGTLSKSLASTGGYIAGNSSLIEMIKGSVPGFVYSVGLPPVLAAAALEALDIIEAEPDRLVKLRQNAALFDKLVRAEGLDTGNNNRHAIVPVMIKSSLSAVKAANYLSELGINVQPIIYPAVEEKLARLRFFISSTHTAKQLEDTAKALGALKTSLG